MRTHLLNHILRVRGEKFTPARRWQLLCSARCRATARRHDEAERQRWVARALPDDPGRAE